MNEPSANRPSSGDETAWKDAGDDRLCDRYEFLLLAGQRPTVAGFLAGQGIDPAHADSHLVRELDRLADYYDPNSRPTAVTAAACPPAEPLLRPGVVLGGRYELVAEIGGGGMGVVWEAQQTAPVKRRVAVKVIKAGMDSAAILARFDAERQALARMDHPNIARVFDAGLAAVPDERGQTVTIPFFVMELVNGVPIGQFCDERKLTVRQRLELFGPVCHAIQHAHLKGVIHRDIKPGNVLVTDVDGRPVPKVIDFGLAKAVGDPLTDFTLVSQSGQVVGTPVYMSPEQAGRNGADVDSRSDVYSLGVLLYELLTGEPPLDRKTVKKAVMHELLRMVREVDAPKPSARASSTDAAPCANRGLEPKRLSRLLRGDLDWVLLTALEKDRDRRYGSPAALAADVARYLASEPVSVGPPSTAYRLRKFVRRNRVPVSAAAVVFLALVLGVIGTSLGLSEARRQKGEADAARGEEATQRGIANANAADANDARIKAQEAEGVAQREKRNALAVAASSTLDRGQQMCEGGDTVRGLHVLAKALAPAIESGDAALEEAVRFNIDAWLPCVPRVRRFEGRNHSAACSNPSGTVVVTGSVHGELAVWDTGSGQKPPQKFQLGDAILRLAWQPNGTRVAILCRDGTLRLWQHGTDFRSARVTRLSKTKIESTIGALAFHPDGTRLLVGTLGPSVLLLNAATGEPAGFNFAHDSWACEAAAFSPDGKRVVVATPYGTARVYDAETGKPLGPIVRTPGPNRVVAFGLDGTTFLTGHAEDNSFRVWNANTGEPAGPRTPTGGRVHAAVCDPDGATFWVGGGIPVTQQWDWRKGTPVSSPFLISARHIALVADGRGLLLSGAAGTGIWELPNRGCLWTGDPLPAPPKAAAFRPDGTELAVSLGATGPEHDLSRTGFVFRFRIATGGLLPPLPALHNYGWVWDIKYSRDGRHLYGAAGSGITVWGVDSASERTRLTDSRAAKADFSRLAISADDRFVAAAGFGKNSPTVAWDTASRTSVLHRIKGEEVEGVLGFVPNTGRLFGVTNGQVTTSDLGAEDREKGVLLSSHLKNILAAAFRDDGGAVALMDGGSLFEFDLRTGRGSGFTVDGLIEGGPFYTPGGRLLYVTSPFGVTAWHPRSGKRVGPHLGNNSGTVFGVSPDGNSVLTIGGDRRPQLWRVPRPYTGSPEELDRAVRNHTGFASSSGNVLRPAHAGRDPSDEPPPLPPAAPPAPARKVEFVVPKRPVVLWPAVADFREAHGVDVEELKAWTEGLPAGFRPVAVSARAGGAAPRFDAIATKDNTAFPFALRAELGRPGAPYPADFDQMRADRWHLRAVATYKDGDRHLRHHLWAKDGRDWGGYGVRVADLPARVAEWRRAGLRPLNFHDTHVVPTEPLLGVVLGPDEGRAWEIVTGLSATALAARATAARADGWRIDALHGTGVGADRTYTVSLVANPRDEEWELKADLTPDGYAAAVADGRTRDLRPLAVTSAADGERVRYAAVFVRFTPIRELAPPPRATQ